ncbi:LysR family transcriptional regulator [Microbacterium excoecariae]|uniref:LysR family transcriptional regulator n=1 Tax=Microbacterium excoecariae TaxID=2715210 RepID=UPI00140C1C1A|nr:LysR family transcriptional regulator [Microbacterium excoecariae]NHI17540.1 LysR family transcriptional regulator [Microbacterium excoecariae]
MHDLRGVVALRALEEQGSIAGAALALGYTASGVSQQLSALEREVGVPLIDRGPKSARLNAAGLEFLASAGDVIGALEVARSRATAAVGRLSGRIVVAAIPSLAGTVAAAVAGMRAREPLLDVVLVQSSTPQAQRALVEATVDIAVVDDWGTRSAGLDSRLEVERCFEDSLVLAAPRGAGDAPRDESAVALVSEALATMPFLSATEGSFSREFADAWLAREGLSPRVRWEFDGLDTLAELVAHGRGLALLPATVVAPHREDGRTRELPLPGAPARIVNCAWRAGGGLSDSTITRAARMLATSIVRHPRSAGPAADQAHSGQRV